MLASIFKKLTSLRDYALTILGVIYGIGYLSWSVYAYKNSLGTVSAVESQYLVSGIVPFLISCFSYYFIRFGFAKIVAIRRQIHENPLPPWPRIKRIHSFFLRLLALLITLSIVSLSRNFSGFLEYLHKIINGQAPLSTYLTVAFCLFVLTTVNILEKFPNEFRPINSNDHSKVLTKKPIKPYLRAFVVVSSRFHRFYIMFYIWLSYFFSVIGLLPIYYYFIFPYIPQELGGVKPKRCYFELKREDILLPRTDHLLSASFSADSSVVRSDTLLVYYYNDDKLLVKTKSDSLKVFELSRDIVKTITWLD